MSINNRKEETTLNCSEKFGQEKGTKSWSFEKININADAKMFPEIKIEFCTSDSKGLNEAILMKDGTISYSIEMENNLSLTSPSKKKSTATTLDFEEYYSMTIGVSNTNDSYFSGIVLNPKICEDFKCGIYKITIEFKEHREDLNFLPIYERNLKCVLTIIVESGKCKAMKFIPDKVNIINKEKISNNNLKNIKFRIKMLDQFNNEIFRYPKDSIVCTLIDTATDKPSINYILSTNDQVFANSSTMNETSKSYEFNDLQIFKSNAKTDGTAETAENNDETSKSDETAETKYKIKFNVKNNDCSLETDLFQYIPFSSINDEFLLASEDVKNLTKLVETYGTIVMQLESLNEAINNNFDKITEITKDIRKNIFIENKNISDKAINKNILDMENNQLENDEHKPQIDEEYVKRVLKFFEENRFEKPTFFYEIVSIKYEFWHFRQVINYNNMFFILELF